MIRIRKFAQSKAFMGLLWAAILIAVWELFATIVAHTQRTPENFLPHIGGILNSIFSTQKINGTQTASQMVLQNAGATLSRAGLGFAIGAAAGFVLALLMSLFDAVEKIAFPYLMLIKAPSHRASRSALQARMHSSASVLDFTINGLSAILFTSKRIRIQLLFALRKATALLHFSRFLIPLFQ